VVACTCINTLNFNIYLAFHWDLVHSTSVETDLTWRP
jgi:hypothetical protein